MKRVKLYLETNQGCQDSLVHEYMVYERISADFEVLAPCFPAMTTFRDSISTSGSPVVSRTWNLGDNTFASGDSVVHQYMGPGTYSVLYTIANAEGCVDSIRKNIFLNPSPSIDFNILRGTNPFCPGDTLLLRIIGGNTVLWRQGLSTQRDRAFTRPGIYHARTLNGPDCYTDDSIRIDMYPPATAFAGNDTSITRGRLVQLQATGGVNYRWTPTTALSNAAISNPIARPLETTDYAVEVIDSNGCRDRDTMQIEVTEPLVIRIPNVITPNNDGKNDVWDLSEIPLVDQCTITVYDNQGRVVFRTAAYGNNWGGTMNGKVLPEGTYLYHIDCPADGETFKGYLQILK